MPYSDDPEHVPADQVRFLLGDTNNEALAITDSEVAYLLASEGGNPLRAAARGAEQLAGKYAAVGGSTEKRVGPLMIRDFARTDKASRYSKLARVLWARALAATGQPFAGGISKIDKAARRGDLDIPRPSFRRRLMHYGLGVPASGSSSEEELLGEREP